MSDYPFHLIRNDINGRIEDKALLTRRPFTHLNRSFQDDAERFVSGEKLETAINTAIAVGEPLLITGEPGTGKTQAAYYIAHKLDIEPIIHFQVKSDTNAHELLYHFDTVRYFHDAHLIKDNTALAKEDYIEPRALWEAFKSAETSGFPRVLLIDEIDKAPRDFPNDLLHELDKMEFTIIETGEKVSTSKSLQPIVIITSNSERRLPEPFLRRCVYHHIRFDDNIVAQAIESRKDEFQNLSEDFLKMAIQRFLALRDRSLRKRPATGELIIWLRVLSLAIGTYPDQLDDDLSKLPYLSTLLKDHQDIDELKGGRLI